MKFLLGKVVVKVIVFNTEHHTNDQLTTIGNENDSWDVKLKGDLPKDANIEEYAIGWTEGGVLNPEQERNIVLGAFLKLMETVIPKADYDPPRIITDDNSEGPNIIQLPK